MTGRARAWGAITILNATATGIGCALAVDRETQAEWQWGGESLQWVTGGDDRVVRAVAGGRAARASCKTPWPAARGLKTSSSAAASLTRAACRAEGTDLAGLDLVKASVATARRAGVTLTGAFDDQCAVVLGGCRVTDNRADAVVQVLAPERWHVAVWVPEASIDKRRLQGADLSALQAEARSAQAVALRGHIASALTRNGAAFTRAYAALGLPVSPEPARVALAAGALGAGLSGTGPAVAALFETPTALPQVAGGHWSWARVVQEPA